MVKRLHLSAVALLTVILVTVSCGGPTILVNKVWVEKNPGIIWKQQQGLVLPVDIHLGGSLAMRVALAASLAGGFAVSSKGRWISMQPAIAIPPFDGNITHSITWWLPHSIKYHNGGWDPAKDAGDATGKKIIEIFNAIPGFVKKGIELVQKATGKKIEFEPRFLIVAHIDGGKTMTFGGKGVRSMDIKAVMYDTKDKTYIAYTRFESRMPWTGKWAADKAILIGKMATVGGDCLANLTKKLTKKK